MAYGNSCVKEGKSVTYGGLNGGNWCLLYSRLEPLRPSADIPQVGTQKDTYGLRFAQFHYTLVDDEIHYLYAQLVTLLF